MLQNLHSTDDQNRNRIHESTKNMNINTSGGYVIDHHLTNKSDEGHNVITIISISTEI